jgi:small subunit ribosomal protein S6
VLRRYEGLFLFDSAVVRDWSSTEAEVKRLMERIGAVLLVCVKFDERKLAYEIRRRKRGTYVLTYFDADQNRIGELERDAQLSEVILRALVLRRDLSEEKLAALKAHQPDVALVPAGDGRRSDEGGHRYDDRGDRGDRRGGRHSDMGGDGPAREFEEAVPAVDVDEP